MRAATPLCLQFLRTALLCGSAILLTGQAAAAAVAGTRTVWHPLEITFSGPTAAETDTAPNPFLDYRLNVVFTDPGGERFVVPGFFDGDGHGGARGNAWRVRFAPSAPGTWKYEAKLRRGDSVAIRLEPEAGEAVELPAASGSFDVAPRDPTAPGFLKWGRLAYVGKHYLKFQDGPYWLRGGTDEPEDFLGYAGFVRTPPKHKYAAHVEDWRPGDPDWSDGEGRGIIGALNYLAAAHVNSIYFLVMNVGGDGRDVWPWTSPLEPRGNATNDNLHFDTGKLAQWEIVFAHAQRQGIFLHCVLNEAEEANKRELDDGELGPERKLYYREMIARFGHHLALHWNLCEEYNLQFDFGAERVRAFADYIRALDPYDHPITVHSAGDPVKALGFTFGDPRFSMTSIQLNQRPIHEVTEAIWRATREMGRPLPVSLDEFTLDRGQRASHIPVDDAEGHRREKIWPTYFSGGMIEFILDDLLRTDNFKTPEREKLWRYLWFARRFMEENLPFWEMEPADELSSGGGTLTSGIGKGRTVEIGPQVFAKRGVVYAVYLPVGSPSGTLDLSALVGAAEQQWFNPRTGEFVGPAKPFHGGAPRELGPPPADVDQDWVVLIRRADEAQQSRQHFPSRQWETRSPADVRLDPALVAQFAERVGGDGCIVRDGYLVQAWGNFERHKDWASAAKPVLSTLLLAAVTDGRLPSVDATVIDVPWPLKGKDSAMTFRHLANMTSGYGRGEAPGAAWAYNDHAIQLYARSLEKVLGEPLDAAFRKRFAQLEFEDGEFFGSRHGLGVLASPRDFGRLGWLWLNAGKWNGQAILPPAPVTENFRAQVPAGLPRSASDGESYLDLGSYGGGTDQTPHGPGYYGFNFWFNKELASGKHVWPGLPADTFQANGMWNRDTVTVIPSLNMVVAVRGAQHERFAPGDAANQFNANLRLLAQAATTDTAAAPPAAKKHAAIDISRFRDSSRHWRNIRDDSRFIQALPDQPRYEPEQVEEIVANILLFERAGGGWPKDYDMLAVLTEEQKAAIRATHEREDASFDNHNLHSQVDYLARAYSDNGPTEWRDACLRGFDFLLAAQLPNGGFPQRAPHATGYAAHITFNDGVMIGILDVLADAAEGVAQWKWLDEARREKARLAVEHGVECILKCQIRADGRATGWCQQHDEQTYAAASARTFELASCCPQETTEIVRFLMRDPRPRPEIVAAIDAAVAWLRQAQLRGIRIEKVAAPAEEFLRHRADFDVVVVVDDSAPPIWARHYEIESGRPIFAGRDGVKRYALAEIERERRTGTPWYGAWPRKLLDGEYPRWRETLNR